MCELIEGDGGVTALAGVIAALRDLSTEVDDSVRIDRIRALEELKSAAAAAQAAQTAMFAASQRAGQLARGIPAERASRGIGSQIGLARRQSPFRARQYVGWCTILTTELPRTFSALQSGTIPEWRAMIVARETAWLSREHRREVDTIVAPELGSWGDRRVENEVKRHAYRLDPDGYVERLRTAAAERHVGIRPAPDTMSRLTALVPNTQGVAAYAALRQHADTLKGQGDPRSRGQIMADTLIERITGQANAENVAVEIQLLMTDHTLFGDRVGATDGEDEEPAHLIGYGPIPADTARHLAFGPNGDAPRWIRRLYRHPDTGALVAMDSRRRCFPEAQRRFITTRDQTCRTPFCDAPIRHLDHVTPAEAHGPTSLTNGQGYCAACNYARQAPGWTATTSPAGAGDEVIITTPTGHRYSSRPPDPPGAPPKRSTEPARKPRAA